VIATARTQTRSFLFLFALNRPFMSDFLQEQYQVRAGLCPANRRRIRVSLSRIALRWQVSFRTV